MFVLTLPFNDQDEEEVDEPSAKPGSDSFSSRMLKNENDFSLENLDISLCILDAEEAFCFALVSPSTTLL